MKSEELIVDLPIDGFLSKPQADFLHCLVPNVAFIGGLGSGKTLIICLKAIVLSIVHMGLPGIVVAPTYKMLNNPVIVTMRDELLRPMGLWQYCKWSEQRKELKLPWGSTIYFASADNPESLRGPNLCWVLVDEATIVKHFHRVFVSLSSRLRHSGAAQCPNTGVPLYHLAVSGTPEGQFDELHERFIEGPREPAMRKTWKRTYQVISTSTYDNPGLSQAFLDQLETTISEEMKPAHIGGQYLDISAGKAYYQFDFMSNVRREAVYDPTLPLRFSWDFNVNPMVCTVWQIRARTLLMGIDEIAEKRSNTPRICRTIIDKYGRAGIDHRGEIMIYGDSTGAGGTAGRSDYDVIFEYLGQHFGDGKLELRIHRKNTKHERRLRSVNSKMRNGRGAVTLWMNPRMHRLIRDVKYQGMDGMSKNKKQEVEGETLGHASDTLDYICDYEFPYVRPEGRTPLHSAKLSRWYEEAVPQ